MAKDILLKMVSQPLRYIVNDPSKSLNEVLAALKAVVMPHGTRDIAAAWEKVTAAKMHSDETASAFLERLETLCEYYHDLNTMA
ncbi:hypothetical protein BC831DRAFT_518005, partial [Entophlyctis helioformis]